MPQITKMAQQQRPTKPVVSVNGQQGADPWGEADQMRLLLYGESGSGKTTLWATFPGPLLALICSGGNKPGELKSINTPENRRKITPVICDHSDRLCDELEKARAAVTRWTTVVLDHVSGLSGMLIKEFQGLNDIPAVRSFGMAQQAEWGAINEKTIGILRGLLNLPCNVVIVGQERVFKGREETAGCSDIIRPTIGVAVTPGVAGWLCPAVDYAVQAFKRPRMVTERSVIGGVEQEVSVRGKGVDYCLRTEPHDVFYTKFRIPLGRKLPDVVVNPTYDKIARIIAGT